MEMVDWFTNLSDGLQVAFVSFLFTIVSSLTTIWITNRHTWNLERQRWKSDRERDEEIYERTRKDRELVDQRRLVESLANDCSVMAMKLGWLSAHSSTLYIPLLGGKGLRKEDAESVLMPMEKITMGMGLCVDEPMRALVVDFAGKCQALFEENNGRDVSDAKQNLMQAVSAANALVQTRARELLNASDARESESHTVTANYSGTQKYALDR